MAVASPPIGLPNKATDIDENKGKGAIFPQAELRKKRQKWQKIAKFRSLLNAKAAFFAEFCFQNSEPLSSFFATLPRMLTALPGSANPGTVFG